MHLQEIQKPRRGRPHVENPLVKRAVRFRPDQLDALTSLAETDGLNFSELVRVAIDNYMSRSTS